MDQSLACHCQKGKFLHNSPAETAVSARKHVLVSESVTKISDAAEGKMFPLKNLQMLSYIQEAPRQPET